jgi:hypothetical protein
VTLTFGRKVSKDGLAYSAGDIGIRFLRSNRRIFWMTIHNDIIIQTPRKSRKFDIVIQNFLQVPCFLNLGQVELVATAAWYFYQVWVIPKKTS